MKYYTVNLELWRGTTYRHPELEFFTIEVKGKTTEEMNKQNPGWEMERVRMHELQEGERLTFSEDEVEVFDE